MFIVDANTEISPDPSELVGEGDSLGIPEDIMDIAVILSIDNQWGLSRSIRFIAPDSVSLTNGNVDTSSQDSHLIQMLV